MTAIPIDDYFASVEARFESPSPYGRYRKEEAVMEIKQECTRKGCHEPVVPGKRICAEHYAIVMAGMEKKRVATEEPEPAAHCEREPKPVHVPVVADVRVRVNEPDYRMELIDTLADLLYYQHYAGHNDEFDSTIARIKAVARDV